MKMKYFVVSDVHDHYSLMREALNEKGFDPSREDHVLVLCGDAFYSGPEPRKLFKYLKDLHEKGKLVFIYGNHDCELLENLDAKHFGKRPGNRKCAELVTGRTGLSDVELADECEKTGFTEFLRTVPVWYFETEHYVFTHGFIPTEKNKYRPDWRLAGKEDWKTAANHGDGMKLSMRFGVREPGKIIVFGHYSAARCYVMKDAAEADWTVESKPYKDVSRVPKEGFRPFFGGSFIAMDQSVKKTGFVNCIVLED